MDSWFMVLLVISVSTIRVDSQLDSGFINIDCGLPSNSTLIDSETTLTYVSDDQFIDTGVNYRISSEYATNSLLKKYLTVRSFPNGTRNCYTLRSLKSGSKYLIRGLFMYGNYDKLNKPPTFDVHLGVNYWDTVELTTSDDGLFIDIIATATSDNLQVCLINKNQGTPFISALELRQLKTSIYTLVNSTQSLVVSDRRNLGARDQVRFPDDPYDRIWSTYTRQTWTNVSTSSKLDPDIDFETPSLVMQTAASTLNTAQPLEQYWNSDNESTVFYAILHFSEIQNIPSNGSRQFDVFANGFLLTSTFKTASGWAYIHHGYSKYNVSLKATSSSTLPPLLNALEVYIIRPSTGIPTNNEDVAAMNTIKANYRVNKDWSGDPCAPKELLWHGVTCTSGSAKTLNITALNLSSSGLTGSIVSSFGDLSALQSLDISYNDLSGDLPIFLDKLSALTYLDVTGNNKISTTLPPGLHNKSQNGNLIFRFGRAPPPPFRKKKSPVLIIVVTGVVALLLIAASIITVLCLRTRKYNQSNTPGQIQNHGTTPEAYNHQPNYANSSRQIENHGTTPEAYNHQPNYANTSRQIENHRTTPEAYNHQPNYANTPQANNPPGNIAGENYANVSNPNEKGEGILDFENRRFSYNDLMRITNKFQDKIGTGGFGSVYLGALENGTQVAVKMRNHSSSQGVKEFLAEAQNLARVHHRYLVSLIGHCMDGDCMALVYEYMKEGTLQDKLMDNERPLSWKQRVRIAYESALGLDYLHKACNPPLIHRDVKTSNILLNENLEARISDFGLSRAFNNANSHISTKVVGTPGYLDPEYYSSFQLSEKSDVFSFGVVLLEIITGQPPVIAGPEGCHLKQWVNQKLSRGDIESIADPRMHGQFDINSVWKVTDLARRCTDNSSAHRPTMNTIVTELKESLDLEISTEGNRGMSTTSTNSNNYSRKDRYGTDVSQNSVFEMAYMGGMSAPGPKAR
ncbi:putative LRR receptor-like serine/threonine-protein kinase At1g51880 [Carex rostrata]